MRRHKVTLFLALLFAMGAVPSLKADVLLFNTWESFFWNDGGTVPFPTLPPTWTFTTLTNTQLQITDGFEFGDMFSVAIAGTLNTTLNTSAVNPALDGVPGPGTTGPLAWADTRYSRVAIDLGPGTYTLTIDIIKNARGHADGVGFIQDAAAVPEPGTITLLGTVLLGAVLLRRRRPVG